MPTIIASQGDSITSIADEHGFFWETIWNHPDNADLKRARKNPNIIAEGDAVFIPDLEIKKENRPAEARHTFKKKGVPAKLKLRLTRLDQPRANERYTLLIDGKLVSGSTDVDGNLEHSIPPGARSALLKLMEGKEEYPIAIGGLDPFDTPSGALQRLENMGFVPGASADDPQTITALKNFQNRHGLTVNGKCDAATMQKIDDMHV